VSGRLVAGVVPSCQSVLDFSQIVRGLQLLFLQLDLATLLTSANGLLSAAGKESLDQNDVGIAIADCSE
jgi:hypothetical protein